MKVFSFRNIRVLILLILLASAIVYTQEQKRNTQYWYKPLNVIIFPINGDGHPETQTYINLLEEADFKDIDEFFSRSAREYQLITDKPFQTRLGPAIESHPPTPPRNGNIFSVIWWSLKLRYWAYSNTPDDISNTDRIRLFVIYHQANGQQALAHSLGLQKGLIGVIHAFADEKQNHQNAVVIAHEILHTVGAVDKYGSDNLPLYPVGYAEPNKQPLWPQRYAEIMAGRIPIDEHNAEMPQNLKSAKLGHITAKEINWIQ